ncbi:MAG: KpsF/GutQ family sugar-phosphate isomerase [Bacteroidia bacterium]
MLNSTEILQVAKETLLLESQSLKNLTKLLTNSFVDVTNSILESNGRVVVTGIGKSAIIGQKIVATFNSTGTPSLFMHAADAIHGDLGMVQRDDVVICISKSGNSPEIKVLVPLILKGGNKLVAITGNLSSHLAKHSHYLLDTTVSEEACPNNLAPTTSTTAQMAMGDALAVALIKCREFKSQDFAKYHPGGALGKKLYLTLGEIAEQNKMPLIGNDAKLAACIVAMTKGRMGAVLVINDQGDLKGIITDGDLRRMLTKHTDIGDFTAEYIMTANPKTIEANTLAIDGVSFIKEHKKNHNILAENGKPTGVIHIQDLIREGLI